MADVDIIGAGPTRVHRLANGLTLVVREDRRTPVVAIVTRVAAGYFDESDEVVGISHVLEHMFFKGTPARGPGEIGRATKRAGGYLNASTIYNRTLYYTVLPSESLAHGIALQSDALLNATIDDDELRRELRVIIEEAKRKRDNPGAVARESLFALLFERHRMGRWRIGTESGLAALTRADVYGFYRQYYRGSNVVLAVVGDVDASQVIDLVEEHYAALDGAPPPRDHGPDEPPQSAFRYRRIAADVTTAYIEFGWRTVPVLHPDAAALDVLALTLGQGRASRLFRNVRDAGHAHIADSHHYTVESLGVFGISVETTPDRVSAALAATAREAQRAALGFSDAEIERTRNLLLARLLRRAETVEGQANLLADWQALGDWRLAVAHYGRMLETDARAVAGVAERYLQPDAAALLVNAPAEDDSPLDADTMRARLFGGAAPAPAATSPIQQPLTPVRTDVTLEAEEDGVRTYRSAGGARIVVLPRPGAPLVSIAVAAAGGTCTEDITDAGATLLAVRAALRGTRSFSATELAERVESLGGSIGAHAGADEYAWTLSVPARRLDEGIALLAEAALHPTFPDEELERERATALAALDQTRDDMRRYPMRLCLAAAFPHHPYGFPLEAQESSLAALTRDRVVTWHAGLAAAGAATFFIVGDVDPDEAARLGAARLDQRTGDGATTRPCAAIAAWPESSARAVVRRERAQTALALAFPGPRRTEIDADALRLLGNAVGGLGGRLFEELRSRRSLAYTVSAAPLARSHGGAFLGYIATSPDREEEARAALLAELQRLREEPLDAVDVERAQHYMIGARRIRRQTNSAQLADLADALLRGRGLAEIREYEQRIRGLGPEDLRAAAARWLDASRLVEGVVRGG